MESPRESTADGGEEISTAGVRLIVLNLPEDEGEGLGFRLTRTLWDPYPWVREVTPGSRAESAGLRTGDCLLQADGKDLLGLPIGQVAGLIRGDGAGRGVSLLCWNCGVDPDDDPELLWSCGGAARGERARRALAGVVRALACCVCAATAASPLSCARSHLYCAACWARLDRCALCREALPPKESPYAKNLVAEQVFEAIATEYDIKNSKRLRAPAQRPAPRSPLGSPVARRGYQLSMLAQRRLNSDKCASDPNIQRSLGMERQPGCSCENGGRNNNVSVNIPSINVEQADGPPACQRAPRLLARVRPACSLLDLPSCQRAPRSPHEQGATIQNHSNSADNLNINFGSSCESPVFVLSAPPIYVLTCDHDK